MFKRQYFISAMRYKYGKQEGWNYATLVAPRSMTAEQVVAQWRKEAEEEYPDCQFHVTTFNRV